MLSTNENGIVFLDLEDYNNKIKNFNSRKTCTKFQLKSQKIK